MNQEEKLEALTSIMNKMRGRLFTCIEASAMAGEKEAACKRQVRDITSLFWESMKELLRD